MNKEISLHEAEKIFLDIINARYKEEGDSLILLNEETIEKEYGWYFFSSSKRFQETQSISDMVAGNGVMLVKKDGTTVQFGTALSAEEYIAEYEKGLKS